MVSSDTSITLCFSFLVAAFITSEATAEPLPDAGEQVRQQQQRQRALEQQIEPKAPDVRLSPPASGFGRLSFPAEKPCFPLTRIVLEGQQALPHS